MHAARTRLRPILMTSFSFILGVAPLAVATGAGAEMRQSLGTAVLFGMLGVTGFGLLFTPAFYTFVRKIGRKEHAGGGFFPTSVPIPSPEMIERAAVPETTRAKTVLKISSRVSGSWLWVSPASSRAAVFSRRAVGSAPTCSLWAQAVPPLQLLHGPNISVTFQAEL